MIASAFVVFSFLLGSAVSQAMPLPTQPGDEVYLDPDTLEFYLGDQIENLLGDRTDEFFDRLEGVRLFQGDPALQVEIGFKEKFVLNFADKASSETGQLYRVDVPRMIRFDVTLLDGELDVDHFGYEDGTLKLYVKLPAFPDGVYPRKFSADLASGDLNIVAGVLGNFVAVVARGNIYEKQYEGVSWFESLLTNLRFSVNSI